MQAILCSRKGSGPRAGGCGGTGQRLQVTRCSRDAVGPSDPCFSAGTCSHHKASPESLPAHQEYDPLTTLFRCCVHFFFLTKVFLKNHKEPRVLSGQVDKASQSLHVRSRTRCPGSSAVSSVTGPSQGDRCPDSCDTSAGQPGLCWPVHGEPCPGQCPSSGCHSCDSPAPVLGGAVSFWGGVRGRV